MALAKELGKQFPLDYNLQCNNFFEFSVKKV